MMQREKAKSSLITIGRSERDKQAAIRGKVKTFFMSILLFFVFGLDECLSTGHVIFISIDFKMWNVKAQISKNMRTDLTECSKTERILIFIL